MAPIASLLQTVFGAILEVFLVCIAGYVLAVRGILDKKTQKQINRLNVSLFTPSLLFSKVAFFLSPAKLKELWAIPLFFILVTVVSMTIAMCLGFLFRLKKSQRSFAMAAAMFMNSNSLPIALMQSLVVTVPGLKWDDDDNNSSMIGRALTYLVLYSTMGMVLRWSYGVHLLTQADSDTHELGGDPAERSPLLAGNTDTQDAEDGSINAPTVLFANADDPEIITSDSKPMPSTLMPEESGAEDSLDETGRQEQSHFFYSFPNTPTRSAAYLPQSSASASSLPSLHLVSDGARHEDCDRDDDEDDDDELSTAVPRRRFTTSKPAWFQLDLRRAKRKVFKGLKLLNQFMTVPLWAALASIVVACIAPLQHALDVHAQPIKGALTAAGNCSIPLTLVVLGAYFYSPEGGAKDAELPQSSQDADNDALQEQRSRSRASMYSQTSLVGSVRGMFKLDRIDRDRGASARKPPLRPGETKTVVIAVLSRMVLTPLVLLPLMTIAAKYDWPAVFDDPIFVVSNVLLVSSPPALTLAQITQAASGDAFERLISRTIFWAYCIVTPPATIVYVVIGLLLAKL